jgi:hypothetical protein
MPEFELGRDSDVLSVREAKSILTGKNRRRRAQALYKTLTMVNIVWVEQLVILRRELPARLPGRIGCGPVDSPAPGSSKPSNISWVAT